VGEATLEVRGEIAREPDRAADGFILGPRVLMSRAALDATGIVRPGSLITWRYRVQLPPGAGADDVQALRVAATEAFPDTGWSIRTRDRATPGIDRFLDRLTFLLTLVGLTALIVGGLGIANAVSAFLERKRSTIAILKCLGASSGLVFRVYLIEVLVIATLGIGLALALGAAAPFVIEGLFADVLPVPIAAGLDAGALGIALAFGYLVTLAFALWPLAIARTVAPTALFRMAAVSGQPVPEPRFVAVIGLCLALLGILALVVLDNRNLTAWYLFGLAASFLLLTWLAALLMWAAARWVRPRGAVLRYAVANLYRPGAATNSILVSLGLGLSLFVTLALMDRNISAELQGSVPEQAPSFFFLDVQSSELDDVLALLDAQPGLQAVETAPMLRGRVQELNGVPVSQARPDPEVAWAVRGDRGFTYAENLPQGSTLAAGEWWPAGYDGPPLVSFAEEIAAGIGLEIGETITVNVLGRDITATLANTRYVDWRSLQINFAMVFSPNTLRRRAACEHCYSIDRRGERERDADRSRGRIPDGDGGAGARRARRRRRAHGQAHRRGAGGQCGHVCHRHPGAGGGARRRARRAALRCRGAEGAGGHAAPAGQRVRHRIRAARADRCELRGGRRQPRGLGAGVFPDRDPLVVLARHGASHGRRRGVRRGDGGAAHHLAGAARQAGAIAADGVNFLLPLAGEGGA
jgi:putative ABC transport system permease protein